MFKGLFNEKTLPKPNQKTLKSKQGTELPTGGHMNTRLTAITITSRTLLEE